MSPTRNRWWILIVPVALVAIYTVGWVVYADRHLRPQYSRSAPGAAADARGATWRVLALTSTSSLFSTASSNDRPAVPDAGAVWVVADLEVLQPAAGDRFSCEVELLGPGEQVWETGVPPVSRAASCDPDAFMVGQPYRFEAVFQVPERAAHRLGILVPDSSTAARTPVLTPPA